MCGRFVQYSSPEVYASRFDLDAPCAARPRYNLAPTQTVLAVRDAGAGRRELVPLRWGLVPAWSKGPDSRYSMINARAETVASKPAYRNAFRHRRCLIPAEGFYEWKAQGRAKIPFLIRREDREPFAMAGLWERWRGPDGGEIESCTIVVTEANALARRVHDRMPAILLPEDYAAWLDPNNRDLDGRLGMLRPIDPGPWTMDRVSPRVNSPDNDLPELLEPLETGARRFETGLQAPSRAG